MSEVRVVFALWLATGLLLWWGAGEQAALHEQAASYPIFALAYAGMVFALVSLAALWVVLSGWLLYQVGKE